MPGTVQINQIPEGEYKRCMGLYKVLTIASGTAMVAGLAGIVASLFISPESSELIKQISAYSRAVALGGGIATAYFGTEYLGNKKPNENRQTTLERQ